MCRALYCFGNVTAAQLSGRGANDRYMAPKDCSCTELSSMCGWLQGSARVIRCLQDNREELSVECSTTLFDQEVCSDS